VDEDEEAPEPPLHGSLWRVCWKLAMSYDGTGPIDCGAGSLASGGTRNGALSNVVKAH
jgi:hypothetical protein